MSLRNFRFLPSTVIRPALFDEHCCPYGKPEVVSQGKESVCPKCGGMYELLSGRDISIKNLQVELEDES